MRARELAGFLRRQRGRKSRNGRRRGNGRQQDFCRVGLRWQRRFTPAAAARSQTESSRPCELAARTTTTKLVMTMTELRRSYEHEGDRIAAPEIRSTKFLGVGLAI